MGEREDGENEKKDFTVKKCIPILDAFTTGYYLVTKYDSYWSLDEDGTHECRCDAKLVLIWMAAMEQRTS